MLKEGGGGGGGEGADIQSVKLQAWSAFIVADFYFSFIAL